MVAAPVLGRYLILALAGWSATASGEVYMLVVAGLGGEPAYAEAFASNARAAADHAEQSGATVTLLHGDDDVPKRSKTRFETSRAKPTRRISPSSSSSATAAGTKSTTASTYQARTPPRTTWRPGWPPCRRARY